MNQFYHDILSRIAQPPVWWDEAAVPRYEPFHPKDKADIYADEVALMEIRCQSCGQSFNVAWSANKMFGEKMEPWPPHYGDPPNVDCCPAGATMNSLHVRTIEYWKRELPKEWERAEIPQYELPAWQTEEP